MSLCIKLIGQGAAWVVAGLSVFLAAGFCQVTSKGWALGGAGCALGGRFPPGEKGCCVDSFSVVVTMPPDGNLQPRSLRYSIKK